MTRRRQRGQSLTEVVIACAVMVPLLLLVPILGKYAYLRHTAQQASRAAAWEATATPGTLPDTYATGQRLIDRFYSGPDAVVRSRVPAPGNNAALADPLLNTHSNQALLERQGVVLQHYSNTADSGVLDRLRPLLAALPGSFPPNDKGLVSAHLQVTPQHLRYRNGAPARALEPFDRLAPVIDARSTVLTDAWNAAGPGRWNDRNAHARSVVRQVRSLTPSAQFERALPDLPAMDWLPVVGVIGDLEPGLILPDVTPIDKIPQYAPQP